MVFDRDRGRWKEVKARTQSEAVMKGFEMYGLKPVKSLDVRCMNDIKGGMPEQEFRRFVPW